VTPAPSAPLESADPQRASTLKRKVLDRIRDVQRHLRALQAAMAEFGEDFDLATFQAAFESEEPEQLNRVKALERGVDQLYNYMAELAAFGLELAGERQRHEDTNARADLDALARRRVLSRERVRRLQRLRELRRLLVHEYATATAAQVHEAALILAQELPPFFRAYGEWIKAGFRAPSPTAAGDPDPAGG
jgi:uncharacterized protein YutE (UPF0331/DUF86 family)